jgi:hypothetical protein
MDLCGLKNFSDFFLLSPPLFLLPAGRPGPPVTEGEDCFAAASHAGGWPRRLSPANKRSRLKIASSNCLCSRHRSSRIFVTSIVLILLFNLAILDLLTTARYLPVAFFHRIVESNPTSYNKKGKCQ